MLGQLKDGRLLGVEVKAKTGRLRPEQAYSWSVCVVLVAWHSWPVTCATCCESWGRHDLPDLHSPSGRDTVGLLAGYRLPRGAGYSLPVRQAPRPAGLMMRKRIDQTQPNPLGFLRYRVTAYSTRKGQPVRWYQSSAGAAPRAA